MTARLELKQCIMKTIKMTLALTLMVGLFTITSCGKKKVLKNISGAWTVEDVTQNDTSIFHASYELNKGTMTFGSCSSKENKNSECEVAFSYEMTVLGNDTTLNSTAKYAVVEKGKKVLIGDGVFDVVTLESNKCVLTDNEDGSQKLTYKLKK